MDDLIRRSDVLGYISRLNGCGLGKVKTLEYIRKYVERLPSADRPQGEWRKHDKERDYCSRCKHIFKTRTITKQDKWTNYIDDLGYNYCPNCGARMKGADDEQMD